MGARKAKGPPPRSGADELTTGELLRVLRAFKKGDFAARLPLDRTGVAGEVAEAVNDVVELAGKMADELTRLDRTVGKEGKLGQRMALGEVSGGWQRCVTSVNGLIGDLGAPTTEVGRVIGAVAAGDLSRTMTLEIDGRPLRGEFHKTAKVVNGMVEQLGSFASEVTRVAREVGTEGKLGGQARLKGVAGTWKDLTDSVNLMAGNLTAQVRNIAEVTTAVAKGDLSKKITVDVKGEILQLKTTMNTMVDQLNSFASEVTRVAREVGTEGKLGGQAQVTGVGGTWRDLTENVNSMASNLTAQVRNIAEVTTAVARGDLSKTITVDTKGEILQLKNTINTMVDQLNSFASEVTRVAREVGTEGKLGGQAHVRGVGGTWKDLTDNVNFMASNLTAQVRDIAEVATAVAKGDLTKKVTADVKGELLELKNTINTMADQLNAFAREVTRVAREVGTEGKLGGQAQVTGVGGTWRDLTENVNSMASNLTKQVRDIAEVATAVARGDLTKKVTADVKGELLELKNTINTLTDQLNSFASEVSRVAREVGTEGKLGGQAQVTGVAGTWKDLTDNVNSMASNLTDQVRGIAKVVTAVANGDLKRELALEARGEIAELADTINSMTDTLALFADQVITVAREVGVEGKLGGQAKVPGAAGTWLDLTDNVNQLAGNLTTQVRAITDVATAVTKGDLTREITVGASGEVAALKENINEMIRNLRHTTQKTTEQDWLKTNLAKFTRMLQGQRDLVTVATQILSELAPLVSAQHGVVYLAETDEDTAEVSLKLLASYAYKERANVPTRFRRGEGLVGQCAFEKQKILMSHVPGDYIQVTSGLGEAPPRSIIVLPVIFEGQVNAVVELATFSPLSEIHQVFLDQLTESIGIVVNTIAASMRTETLLQQSQSLTTELQLQQEELRQKNEQLGEKAKLLEYKNREVELAKEELEEKAEQLALTSKYKSEFLANMSHELRTPLNSLLILSRMLSDNPAGNLLPKQVDFARTIHASGADLLALIDDILDLSKIESGTISVESADVPFVDLRDYVAQNFRHVAQQKGLEFEVALVAGLPECVHTDAKRLQQVLKNLLSNAFKFTEQGSVTLTARVVTEGWDRGHAILNAADAVVAIEVTDTGIGIASDKQRIIFEAFQQADGTTSRKYGGTGLGLSISREIARLLGGELRVTASAPGEGSTFVLFLPRRYDGAQPAERRASRPPTPPPLAGPSVVVPRPIPRARTNREELEPIVVVERLDDRETLAEGDKIVLALEGDEARVRALVEAAHARGWKVLVAGQGDVGLALARKHKVAAIVLDLALPDVEGWVVLDQLKHDGATRHVPVAVVATPEHRQRALRMGAATAVGVDAGVEALSRALGVLDGVATRPVRKLLIVEDDARERRSLAALVEADDVATTAVASGQEALAALDDGPYACMVVDLGLPDMTGVELLQRLKARDDVRELPVIVYTGKDLGKAEEAELRRLAGSIILKDVRSPERLLDETSLFLHRVDADLPETQRRMLDELHHRVPHLKGTRVLVVDDDVRNIFAITSALESHQADVIYAESGREGLELLERSPDVDVVLMDIMMPDMDGYEVMRQIRRQPRFADLPVIAVTAKAMRADREKCIRAGASDYIAKPVDMDRLLSLLRVWLER